MWWGHEIDGFGSNSVEMKSNKTMLLCFNPTHVQQFNQTQPHLPG